VQVVIAADRIAGLPAERVGVAVARGWGRSRPDDDVVVRPLSDGGPGLLDVLAARVHAATATGDGPWARLEVEVADARGLPTTTSALLGDGRAWVEAAAICGWEVLADEPARVATATSHGVGELLDAVRAHGATDIVVGTGGVAALDGGAGALTGLGFRLAVADGSGLKVGAVDLPRVAAIGRDWVAEGWSDVAVTVLADDDTPVGGAVAAALDAPPPGLAVEDLEPTPSELAAGLARFVTVAEDALDADGLGADPGTGAGGGLAFGLAAGLGAVVRAGAAVVADAVGLDELLRGADLVVVAGRAAAGRGPASVAAHVHQRAHTFGLAVADVDVHAAAGEPVDGPAGEAALAAAIADAAAARAAAHRVEAVGGAPVRGGGEQQR
jgi:glycerate kinase